jgi:hypothetical protein
LSLNVLAYAWLDHIYKKILTLYLLRRSSSDLIWTTTVDEVSESESAIISN